VVDHRLDLALLPDQLGALLRPGAVRRQAVDARRRGLGVRAHRRGCRCARGWIAGGRVRLRRPLVSIGLIFTLSGLQLVLLAAHAPLATIAVAAALAGFAFSFGSVVWETELQRTIDPAKLSRVSAYNWVGAMAFLPAGYAIAGPVAAWIGISATLWIGAAWLLVSTLLVLSVSDVRRYGSQPVALAGVAAG
jgi:hypothetical protein